MNPMNPAIETNSSATSNQSPVEVFLGVAFAAEDDGFDLPGSSSLLPRWSGRQSDLPAALPRPEARSC